MSSPVADGADHQWITSPTTLSIGSVQSAEALTFTWTEQFKVHFVASGNAVSVAAPADEWVSVGLKALGSFPTQVTNVAGDTRSNFVSDNRTAITEPTLIVGVYSNEFKVTYQTSGNVVPVIAPSDEWVSSGDSATGVFPLQVTIGSSRSNFVSDDRPLSVTTPTVVTGLYSNEFLVHFVA